MYFSVKQISSVGTIAVIALTLGQYGTVNIVTSEETVLSTHRPLLHVEETTVLYINDFNTTTKFKVLAQTNAYGLDEYIPKTEIGRKLLKFRRQAIEDGQNLLSADEIEQLVEELRGGSNHSA